MRTSLIVLIAALLVLPAVAEPPEKAARPEREERPSTEQRIDGAMERMTDRLELTEPQQAEIRPILEDTAGRLGALRAEPEPDRDAMREKAREIMKDQDTRIAAVLTPEQAETYKTMSREYRERMRQRSRDQRQSRESY